LLNLARRIYFDFGNEDEVGEEYSMVLPDSSLYKDFNSETDFVDLKMENIEVYLKPMEILSTHVCVQIFLLFFSSIHLLIVEDSMFHN
jgi:hypothetical protein